jgi:endonuclease YncB( thermonuclease family)
LRRVADLVVAATILALLVALSARMDSVALEGHGGQVVLSDGDSLRLGADRVRLRGLDAPELDQSCQRNGKTYACGREARDALSRLINGRPLACTGWERDRFDRLLGNCTAGGDDINRLMVESGWAVAYGDFESEENAARQGHKGLWAGSFERPRQWRDEHGGMAESEHGGTGAIINGARRMLRFL